MKRLYQRKSIGLGIVAIVMMVAAWAGPAVSAVVSAPTKAIMDLEKKLDSYKVGSNLTSADREQNLKLKEDVIRGTFNVAELSRESLGKHWAELNDTQRAEFVDLMTRLLENKAIFSKEQSQTKNKPYEVKYDKEVFLDDAKTLARVYTIITVPKENVHLNLSYKLKYANAIWRIYDVIVDDASLVTNYQYQFHAIITKYGYNELISRMKAKLAEIDSHAAAAKPATPTVTPAVPAAAPAGTVAAPRTTPSRTTP